MARLGGAVVVGVGTNPDGAQLVFLYFSTIYIYIYIYIYICIYI